ncbi:OmpA family protein [Lacinutrix sp.]|uniref:OmpA family protein n=1 Tax=Lacinutrix sp. TaxID=1937692 RepID=UPI0025B95890|nr:OmpA family protein [Lacinutrix sp.]
MAINLLDLFKEQLTDGVLDNVSGLLGGQDSSSIQKGLMTAAPALLGGIMDKASSKEGASSLFNMLGNGSELDGLSNLNADGNNSEGFLNKGLDLVKMVLGDKASGVIDMVSSVSGIEKESSSSLLSVAGSMVSGVLGKQKASGLDLGSFVGLLSNQGSFLDKFAPAGLSSLLGLASFSGISSKLGDLAGGALGFAGDTGKAALDGAGKAIGGVTGLASDTGKAVIGGAANLASDTGKAVIGGAGKAAGAAAGMASGAASAGGSLIKKILPWAIGIIGLLFAFFLIKGCDSDKSMLDNVKDAANQTTGAVSDAANSTTDAAGNVVNSTVDAAGNAVDAVGNTVNSTVDAAGNAVDTAGKAISTTVDAAGNTISNIAGGIVDASGNVVNAFGEVIGSFFDWSLPNGTKLSIPEGGFENDLLDYIKEGKFEAGKYYALDRLYFNTGSSSLSDDSVNQIENIASIMKAYPEVKILLRGHTDNTGSVNGNNVLSGKRAAAVKVKLVEKGIEASRLETKGMGSVEPIADNATPEGRSKNRRIDASIIK